MGATDDRDWRLFGEGPHRQNPFDKHPINQPTSLFEAAQRGMKMKAPKMAPPKTTKELAKQLVEATYELPRAQRELTDAQNRLERVKSNITRAHSEFEQVEFKETRAILVSTPGDGQKVVTIRMDDAAGVVIEVIDVEDK
jgi:hypothetical protein